MASFLLAFPGLMVACAWAVWAPVVTVEGMGPLGAAQARSADLTRGHRWAIFGLGLVVALVFWVLTIVIALSLGGGGFLNALATPFFAIAVAPAISSLNALVMSCGLSSLHTELARAKEGVASTAVAEIFG
jgi:hypothetical protein